MEIKSGKNEKDAFLALTGRFDFHAHRDFKNAYMLHLDSKDITTITVDLKDVLYMDSSSLGMLLLLKERGEPLHKTIKLSCGQNTLVRNLLAVVSFGKIFDIS